MSPRRSIVSSPDGSSDVFLKLRANLELAGDLVLAAEEAAQYLERPRPVRRGSDATRLMGTAGAGERVRDDSPVGYVGRMGDDALQALLRRSAFVQEVWRRGRDPLEPEMARLEMGARDAAEPRSESDCRAPSSTPHVHALHKYKAKFFPRLARFLLTTHLPAGGRVLDPFAGSGTLGVEARLLGMDALGVDLDPLSCLIARAKLLALESNLTPSDLDPILTALEKTALPRRPSYRLPPWMRRNFERRARQSEAQEHERWIARLVKHANAVSDPRLRLLCRVALSDALTRKFNVRMMGTGVGRFALEVARPELLTLYRRGLLSIRRLLQTELSLPEPGCAGVVLGSALKLPLPSRSIDLVVTSPPYLPASSGRENYSIGKSISLTALGLMTPEEVMELQGASVGSMVEDRIRRRPWMPPELVSLVDWLADDPLRRIKAAPTSRYYSDLRAALRECRRVLRPGGRAVFVVGKESVFYRFRDRKVLRRVPCDRIFAEVARGVGFDVERQFDLELAKRHRNARPRSRDAYYESVIALVRS